jgi:hypothetical protein
MDRVLARLLTRLKTQARFSFFFYDDFTFSFESLRRGPTVPYKLGVGFVEGAPGLRVKEKKRDQGARG